MNNILSIHQSKALLQKYPNCIPVILEGSDDLVNKKLLIQNDMTISKLMCFIRKKNKLNKFEAYFLFIDSILLVNTETISNLYKLYCSENGFLYITVKKENTFG